MLAYPAFDYASDDLHGALHVDLALGIARRGDLLGEVQPVVIPRITDYACAVDWALEVTRQPRDRRVGLSRAAKEHYINAARVILVDEYSEVRAAFQRFGNPDRGVEAGRHQFAHAARP